MFTLYLFEKNSINYLLKTFKEKKNNILEKEPLKYLVDLIKYLSNYLSAKKSSNNLSNINLCKLYCIGYIKIFCYTFITMIHNNRNENLKDISKIIEEINKIDLDSNKKKSIVKTIKLYIYRVIYYLNNKQFKVFVKDDSILKYKLNEFKIKEFIQNDEINLFNYRDKNAINENQNYQTYFQKIDDYKSKNFEKEIINLDDFDLKKYGIDLLFFTTSNLVSSCIDTNEEFKSSIIYENFYKNVLVPLFEKYDYKINKAFNAMQLFYNPEKFQNVIELYKIDSKNIKILLFSYRWFLNEIYSLSRDDFNSSIYSRFFMGKNYFDNIKNYYFPGNDINDSNNIYCLLTAIISHFSGANAKQGCYVCLCEKGWYHNDKIFKKYEKCDDDIVCEKCKRTLWKASGFISKEYKLIKDENVLRIFKDDDDVKKNKKFLLDNEINYLTVEKFKEKSVKKYYEKEKGITQVNDEHFKKSNKIIRELSQISYRLLNFILYSNLFFAKLYTENSKFDLFLPKNLNWIDVLTISWKLLENELNKKKINNIELFMNFIFFDLFNLLNKHQEIENYDQLIEIEDKVEKMINTKIDSFLNDKEKYKKLIKSNKNDPYMPINLLEDLYEDIVEEYPLKNYFYYCDYINEKYLIEKMYIYSYRDYPVTIEYIRNKNRENFKFLRNLSLYNQVLNLFRKKYSFFITREEAEKISLKDNELYKNNKGKIDEFINFYNNLKIEGKGDCKLSIDNKLSDFFIEDNDKKPICKTYIIIYNEFIKSQNESLEHLLSIKTEKGIFDVNCKEKVNIQNIKEDEIFTLNFSSELTFFEIVFNNSYRKYAINNDKNSVNQYEINYEQIEKNMSDILLKNRKLFSEDIIKFIYKNEDLNIENTNIINKFNEIYSVEKELSLEDKYILYNYYNNNKDFHIIKTIISDFKTLILYLINNNNKNKDNNENIIYEKIKIFNSYEPLKEDISEYFRDLFKDKDISINKLSKLFEYFMILAYPTINNEIFDYQIEIPKEKLEKIKNYFNEKHLIKREDLVYAIRIFVSSFLLEEKNQEERIKKNENNFMNYLDIRDIWKKSIYLKNEFKEEINNIKNFDIQLNQISKLCEIIGSNFEEDYFSDILKVKEDEKKKIETKVDENNADNNNGNIQENNINNPEEEEEEELDDIYRPNEENDIIDFDKT